MLEFFRISHFLLNIGRCYFRIHNIISSMYENYTVTSLQPNHDYDSINIHRWGTCLKPLFAKPISELRVHGVMIDFYFDNDP